VSNFAQIGGRDKSRPVAKTEKNRSPEAGARRFDLVVEHIEHILKHVGEDGVGLGSDFDGAMIRLAAKRGAVNGTSRVDAGGLRVCPRFLIGDRDCATSPSSFMRQRSYIARNWHRHL
jgi:microsomal dipeptidase-like Zn-dependent dipeptidase